MYKAALSTIEHSLNRSDRYRRALCHYSYARHLCRMEKYSEGLSYLQSSVAILVELGRREGNLAQKGRSVLHSIVCHLEGREKSQDMLMTILKIKLLLSGSRSLTASSGPQGVIRLQHDQGSDEKWEMRTTTTGSYKYGVTFSVSDITGVSLSEFFVP
jgi:hypothetical protein